MFDRLWNQCCVRHCDITFNVPHLSFLFDFRFYLSLPASPLVVLLLFVRHKIRPKRRDHIGRARARRIVILPSARVVRATTAQRRQPPHEPQSRQSRAVGRRASLELVAAQLVRCASGRYGSCFVSIHSHICSSIGNQTSIATPSTVDYTTTTTPNAALRANSDSATKFSGDLWALGIVLLELTTCHLFQVSSRSAAFAFHLTIEPFCVVLLDDATFMCAARRKNNSPTGSQRSIDARQDGVRLRRRWRALATTARTFFE